MATVQRRVRKDSIRNERALVRAVGELLREDPESVTMPAVAERAELSPATAYRYFPTLEQLFRRFMSTPVEELRDSVEALTSSGLRLFEDAMCRWLDVVDEYGAAMVLIRSREGFLTRLHAGETHANLLKEAWSRPIRELLAEAGIPGDRFDYALAMLNALFNSREMLDLKAASGWDNARIARRSARVYWGALQGLGEE